MLATVKEIFSEIFMLSVSLFPFRAWRCGSFAFRGHFFTSKPLTSHLRSWAKSMFHFLKIKYLGDFCCFSSLCFCCMGKKKKISHIRLSKCIYGNVQHAPSLGGKHDVPLIHKTAWDSGWKCQIWPANRGQGWAFQDSGWLCLLGEEAQGQM